MICLLQRNDIVVPIISITPYYRYTLMFHTNDEPNSGRGATATATPVSAEEEYADRRKLLSSLRERSAYDTVTCCCTRCLGWPGSCLRSPSICRTARVTSSISVKYE